MSINKDEFYNDQIKLIKYYEQCIKENEARGFTCNYQNEINKINKFIEYADLVNDENKKQILEIAFITKKNKELEIISNNYLNKNNKYIIKLEEFVNNLCLVGSLFINISTASFKYDLVTESIDYEGKEGTEGFGNRNLELYPELLNLISPLTEKCFYLFVWSFESEYMQLYGTKLFVKYNDTEQIVINYSRELNKLVLVPFAKKLKIGSFKNTNKKHYQILFRNNEYVL